MKNEGILNPNVEGIVGGHKTIHQQLEEDSSGEIDAVVIDDFGANRYATIVEPGVKENQFVDNYDPDNNQQQ